MIAKNISGKFGEMYAAKHLEQNGYRIICRNYKTKIAEIDIIAENDGCLCFVEVKTRKNKEFGSGGEWVNGSKQHKMVLGAESYIVSHPQYSRFRFDVVEVYGEMMPGGFAVSEINVIKNAFDV